MESVDRSRCDSRIDFLDDDEEEYEFLVFLDDKLIIRLAKGTHRGSCIV